MNHPVVPPASDGRGAYGPQRRWDDDAPDWPAHDLEPQARGPYAPEWPAQTPGTPDWAAQEAGTPDWPAQPSGAAAGPYRQWAADGHDWPADPPETQHWPAQAGGAPEWPAQAGGAPEWPAHAAAAPEWPAHGHGPQASGHHAPAQAGEPGSWWDEAATAPSHAVSDEPWPDPRPEPEPPAPARRTSAGKLVLHIALAVAVGVGVFAVKSYLFGDRTRNAAVGDCVATGEAQPARQRTDAKVVPCDAPDARFSVAGRVDGADATDQQVCDGFFQPGEQFWTYASESGYVLCLRPKG